MALILKSLTFPDPGFRKLKDQTINFSKRFTLIAGHNGAGKSSVLAFVANGSGLTSAEYKSLFDRTFQTHFHDILFLDYENEVNGKKPSEKASVFLEYENEDGSSFRRRASLTRRPYKGKVLARVVNRKEAGRDAPVVRGESVGDSAKVPLPTLFLGMTRMLPIGEADPAQLRSKSRKMSAVDTAFHVKFINSVIPGSASDGRITDESIRSTRKRSSHPKYDHATRAVSVGQDSLSAIATAVVSFRRLKTDWPEYPGGMLVIDEIDAGFHPDAQRRLIKSLKSAANELDLQIVATTHSLPVISEVHPESTPFSNDIRDSVVYFMNTNSPRVLSDLPLARIRADMELSGVVDTPLVEIFAEDDEAAELLEAIQRTDAFSKMVDALKVDLKVVSVRLGNRQLIQLIKNTDVFQNVVVVLDGDSADLQATNVVALPGGSTGLCNPERLLLEFLRSLCGGSEPEAVAILNEKVSTNQIEKDFLEGVSDLASREASKKWWAARQEKIQSYGLLDLWAAFNPEPVEQFCVSLSVAISALAKK